MILLSLALLWTGGSASPAADPRATAVEVAFQAPRDSLTLRRTLERITRPYPGIVGVSVRNLATGEAVSIRGTEKFPSASLIKVSILVGLLDEVRKGTLTLDERTTMIGRDRVGGSGILQHMTPGMQLTLGDLAWLMITISDNTATNLILDKINIRPIWAKMDSLGLPATRIHSKTFLRATSVAMDSSVRYGLGVTTPDESLRLFALLHEGKAVSPALDSLARRMLRANEDATKLQRWLPQGIAFAHKSGDVDQSRSDCGIIYGPDAPVAVCVMTRENQDTRYTLDNAANLLMARIGDEVFRHYNRSERPRKTP